MLKSIICLSIIILCSILGYSFGERYKRRVYSLRELRRAVLQLQNEILYTFTPLPEAIEHIYEKSSGEIKMFFLDLADILKRGSCESVYAAYIEAYKSHCDKLFLSSSDELLVSDLFKSLGEVDIIGHEKIFNLFLETVKGPIEESEELMKKNLKMYRYLGVCVGLGIVIIIL
ncbi:stage III sporulation protein SpoIIIAB [Alloiococcus sp. CFN-8]|uniref:stage III sporulation protein SpoIIIAB n=1 Tax=Alloiococcus sp. CFN-8 TaxID=3416081 RepID=UPI003CF4DF2B